MNKLQGSITRYQYQHEKKVVSDSPGLVDFAIWLVIFVTFLTCPMGKCCFLAKFKPHKHCNQSCQSKRVLGLVEMTCGLVHASYSLPKWQAVKLTFFSPLNTVATRNNVTFSRTLYTYAFPLKAKNQLRQLENNGTSTLNGLASDLSG